MMFDSDTSIEKIFERIRPILLERCRTSEPDKITIASRLIENLGIDSLDWVQISYEIEDEFKLAELDDSLGNNLDKFITVAQLVLEIKKLLEECPYCHQTVSIEQAIQVNDYYEERLVYVHQECETPTRQLEREMLQQDRKRKNREQEEKFRIEEAKRMYQIQKQKQRIRKQKVQTAFKIVLGGMTVYAILLYTLGFNFFILIFILILLFLTGVIFI
ncbi:acyl carrier protein [Microcoleus sp. Pol12B4]|uniref:acyl carrier protein n=1 Tax=Microcoleus sp. Pol12B4 TaxID=3055395 RepID=UPI002FD402CD